MAISTVWEQSCQVQTERCKDKGQLTTFATIVDYAVHGPDKQPGKEKIILDGQKERQGDYVFTATETGEYRFCFDNSMSTFADKVVDFEIAVRLPPPPPLLHTLTSYNHSSNHFLI